MAVTIMQNIESERVRFGITQSELCKKLGVNRNTYYKWKKTDNLPASVLISCMKLFGCTADYLTRGVN